MANAETDLTALRSLYGGRKDVITPSVYSRLSPERQEKVLDEMFTAAREAGRRRAIFYQSIAKGTRLSASPKD